MSALTIREPEAHELEPFLAFVRRELGAPRTRAEQDWQLALRPARRLGAWREGRLVGAVLGRALPVRLAGRAQGFTLVTDLCVAHELRRGLVRQSPFTALLGAFFDHFGGPQRDLVHFGTPVERSWRAGAEALGYELLRPSLLLVRELTPAAAGAVGAREAGGREANAVRVLERFDEQALWLDERCCGAFGASVVRDAEYLTWRYRDVPGTACEALGCFDAQSILRGLALWRAAPFGGQDVAVVLDWLVPDAEPEVGVALERALVRRASARGLGHAALSVPPWSPWFERFQGLGWRVQPAPFTLAVRTFDARLDAPWLRENWWYGLGDLDLA